MTSQNNKPFLRIAAHIRRFGFLFFNCDRRAESVTDWIADQHSLIKIYCIFIMK